MPVRISVIDRDYRIVEANRAFGLAYGEWRGRKCYEVYKGRNSHCDLCNAAETLEDGLIRVHQEEGIQVDGEPSWYLVRVVPLYRDDGSIPFIIEMSTDITATKQLEKGKLEAERLAAVGQTVAGLAHGVKNLLMGLDGGMYMARTGIEKGDPDRLLEGWQILEENVSRITSFVHEFLEFSKGKAPQVHLMDPNAPARQVFALFQHTAQRADVELSLRVNENIEPAKMDEEGVHTCLANLVSNALDACSTSDHARGHVSITTREEGGIIIYEVRDDGEGMEYEVKKKVFTNFFSTKASDKGTGLGLLTTRKIVQEHGGRVSFHSKRGEGSMFRLEFPRHRLPGSDRKEITTQTENVEDEQ